MAELNQSDASFNSGMITVQERFAEAVYRIKTNYGVKQNDIARAMGISPPQLTALKKGTKNFPTVPQVAALHKTYGISAEWLINGIGEIFILN